MVAQAPYVNILIPGLMLFALYDAQQVIPKAPKGPSYISPYNCVTVTEISILDNPFEEFSGDIKFC